MLMTLLKAYLNHYKNKWIDKLRYKESRFHVKLTRQHRRHSLSTKKIIDVYPQIIVGVPKVSLNRIQLDYLSGNGKLKIFFNSYRSHPTNFMKHLLII